MWTHQHPSHNVLVAAVLALALTTSWADDGPVTVKIRDLEYGIMKVTLKKVTGTHFSRHKCAGKISTRTDRVPMALNVGFGVRFNVDVDRGTNLVILTRWMPPQTNDPRRVGDSAYANVAKNHSPSWHCYRLDYESELVPGDWTAEFYLIGMDEEPTTALARLKQEHGSGLLLYRQTFHVYEPR